MSTRTGTHAGRAVSPRAATGPEGPRRKRLALRRLGLAGLAGAAVLVAALAAGGSWSVAVALGWDGIALVYLGSVWRVVFRLDDRATARAALAEDSSRTAADAIVLGAAVASLVAVALLLVDASSRHGLTRGALIALAVASVVAAWTSVHTVFMLRYARLYYAAPVGGIDFHSSERPDFRDFAYVALTIGMTFQVSDTDMNARAIRRTAIRHALLSYVFGAVIIAITINIVASLAATH